jgi:ribosomal protein L9
MRHRTRSLAVSLLFAAVLTPAAHAQPFPESDRQKAQEAAKKAEEKANDEAYKEMLKRTKDVKKTVDPWGNLRTPSPGGNK